MVVAATLEAEAEWGTAGVEDMDGLCRGMAGWHSRQGLWGTTQIAMPELSKGSRKPARAGVDSRWRRNDQLPGVSQRTAAINLEPARSDPAQYKDSEDDENHSEVKSTRRTPAMSLFSNRAHQDSMT